MSLMPQGSEILEDIQEDQDEYFDRLGVYNNEPQTILGQEARGAEEIRTIDGQEFRVVIEEVVSHETLETVTRERLIPVNDQGEDVGDEIIFNDTQQGPVINSTNLAHNTNIAIGSTTISETEIDHPVVRSLVSNVRLLTRRIGRQQEQLNRQQDRLEHLEEQIDRLADTNLEMLNIIKEMTK